MCISESSNNKDLLRVWSKKNYIERKIEWTTVTVIVIISRVSLVSCLGYEPKKKEPRNRKYMRSLSETLRMPVQTTSRQREKWSGYED